jgi:NADPH:quinone reductase-like Zn-dependent oxidoreductase
MPQTDIATMKAVRFDKYGDIDVLQLVNLPIPDPAPGEVLLKVKAASINPGEASIRKGLLHGIFPATFPSGEGTDFAGVVTKVGDGVADFTSGDELIGFSNRRASHAEYVIAEAQNLIKKPSNVAWEVAGSLPVAGGTAYAAVRAVSLKPGDTVAVSGAAGGVGSIAVQLAKRTGAEVIGIASPSNHAWLTAHGVKPLAYGDDLIDRLRAAHVTAFIDNHGQGYVKLAIALGIDPARINTIIDFEAAKQYATKSEGSHSGTNSAVLNELAQLLASGNLEIPIAATFPLVEIRAAFRQLELGHTRGKIVLLP